jgi:chorismate mutase/prephenate dehydrogenase
MEDREDMENGEDPHKQLQTLRQKIRDIDRQILALAAERQKWAQEIGKIKLDSGLPIKDFAVEKAVIESSRKIALDLGLYEDLGAELISSLIKYSVLSQDEYHRRRATQTSGNQKKILIIGGLGRMGQWQAEFFAAFGHSISLYDVELPRVQPVFPMVSDLKTAAQNADVIVLATPIDTSVLVLEQLIPWAPGGLIFDICSLKSPLIETLHKAARHGLRVASVHPMFGPHVDTLAGRNILVCHVDSEAATAETIGLFKRSTAQIVRLDLGEHDQLMSYVLGLSHLINLVFARVLAKGPLSYQKLKQVASTTFNAQISVTYPVIQENQSLYYLIQAANSQTPHLLQAIESALQDYQRAIVAQKPGEFCDLMENSRLFMEGFSG